MVADLARYFNPDVMDVVVAGVITAYVCRLTNAHTSLAQSSSPCSLHFGFKLPC